MINASPKAVREWMDGFLTAHRLSPMQNYVFASYDGSPHNKYHEGRMIIRMIMDEESDYPHDVFAIVPIDDYYDRDELERHPRAFGYIEVSGVRHEHGPSWNDEYTVVNPVPTTVIVYQEAM